jgi:hypothetical protein
MMRRRFGRVREGVVGLLCAQKTPPLIGNGIARRRLSVVLGRSKLVRGDIKQGRLVTS